MFRRVVATAGTSILFRGNLASTWLSSEATPWVDTSEREIRACGEPRAALDAVERRWRAHVPPVSDPFRVGAEYAVLSALAREHQLSNEPQVILVHTDTFAGELAARMNRALLERDFRARVRLVAVEDVDVADRDKMRPALGRFMHTIARVLRDGDPSDTVFAPLGGYKIMTSLGYLAGAYCRYSSVYLHEMDQTLHSVPWVPIEVDEALLREAAPLMHQLKREAIAWWGLSASERAAVEASPWLFDREEIEGVTWIVLGAFGEFLMREERYRALFAPKVLVADEGVAPVLHVDEVCAHAGLSTQGAGRG